MAQAVSTLVEAEGDFLDYDKHLQHIIVSEKTRIINPQHSAISNYNYATISNLHIDRLFRINGWRTDGGS